MAVRVTDSHGLPRAGVPVQFTTAQRGILGNFVNQFDVPQLPGRDVAVATTNAQGIALINDVYGIRSGTATVDVVAGGDAAATRIVLSVGSAPPPARLEVIAGDGQRVANGDILEDVRLQVVDGQGRPVPSALLTLASSQGTFDTQPLLTVRSGADGLVPVPPFSVAIPDPVFAFTSADVSGKLVAALVPLPDLPDRSAPVAFRTPAPRAGNRYFHDLWWGGEAENGWGVAILEREPNVPGASVFVILFVYDPSGAPIWYMMPAARWSPYGVTLEGPVYRTSGAPFTHFSPDAVKTEVAGQARVTFAGTDAARLTLSLADVAGGSFARIEKRLMRNDFSADAPSPRAHVPSLWWGGPAQSGWGVATLEQPGTLFSVWFTYAEDGRPTWFVMPGGTWMGADRYAGEILGARANDWASGYDPGTFRFITSGRYGLTFDGERRATLEYTLPGASGKLALVPFDDLGAP